MEVCVIGWVASRACYIGVIGLSEGGPATRDLPGTNNVLGSCDRKTLQLIKLIKSNQINPDSFYLPKWANEKSLVSHNLQQANVPLVDSANGCHPFLCALYH